MTAALEPDAISRIQQFQENNGIKHFSDAMGVYIRVLESQVLRPLPGPWIVDR